MRLVLCSGGEGCKGSAEAQGVDGAQGVSAAQGVARTQRVARVQGWPGCRGGPHARRKWPVFRECPGDSGGRTPRVGWHQARATRGAAPRLLPSPTAQFELGDTLVPACLHAPLPASSSCVFLQHCWQSRVRRGPQSPSNESGRCGHRGFWGSCCVKG